MTGIDMSKNRVPWALLTDEERQALKAHHESNGTIEFMVNWKPDWALASDPSWRDDTIYRTVPAAPVPDSIDWSHVTTGFNYLARTAGDTAYLFRGRPLVRGGGWDGPCSRADTVLASYKRGTVDWRDSLVIRPGTVE